MKEYKVVIESLVDMIKVKAVEISETSPSLIETQGPFIVLLQCLLDVQTDYLNNIKQTLSKEEFEVVKATTLQLLIADTPEQIDELEKSLYTEVESLSNSDTLDDISNVISFPNKETIKH
jgi:hypothetical protein